MIDFKPLTPAQKGLFQPYLRCGGERGCEYSFVNLYLWGRQKAALVENTLVFFSQFNRKSVYLFPVGCTDKRCALDALIQDARERGIPCRLVGLTQNDCALLEQLYPGQMHYHFDRDSFDYVYDIHDLADLKGKKYQRKRNHVNRFKLQHPDAVLDPITDKNTPEVRAFVQHWYDLRQQADPHADFRMEQAALSKALEYWQILGLEGLILRDGEQILAMTLGSFLSDTTFDVHFEKALDIADGAYAAINSSFANHLREKYPHLQYLNREDDMGLEGLRKAKLSYYPHHMIEKSWACLLEDGYDY